MFPIPADSKGVGAAGGSRTLSIIAFVMGWMCLAALIVILAYLAIKYRDGIKSLAKRIEYWSNVRLEFIFLQLCLLSSTRVLTIINGTLSDPRTKI